MAITKKSLLGKSSSKSAKSTKSTKTPVASKMVSPRRLGTAKNNFATTKNPGLITTMKMY